MNQYDTPEDRYLFIVKSIDISGVGNIAAPEGNIELTKILGETAVVVGKKVSEIDDGRFEIVSHDILLNGTTMTITFLARHPGTHKRQSHQ